jgi:type III secretory pathway component EscR
MTINVITAILQVAILVLIVITTKLNSSVQSAEGTASGVHNIMAIIYEYADAYVRYARYFYKDYSGANKREFVVKQLTNIAERYNLSISKDDITAIVQRAYELMEEATNTSSDQAIIVKKIDNIGDTVTMVKNTTGDNIAFLNEDTKIIKEN